MNGIQIRKLSVLDVLSLQNISKTTFLETYASQSKAEDMESYFETDFSEQQLTKELNQIESAFYFIQFGTKLAGYLKLNYEQAQTEQLDFSSIEIERIYIFKAFQGKKIGMMLVEETIKLAKKRQLDYVWLGVWEENVKAQKFYEKNGFGAFSKHIFRFGTEEQTDILMRIKVENDDDNIK